MVNINGKEWEKLEAVDIQTIISEQDFDESFYFELKDDKVSPKKLMEEISAFSNTFGGYIFIGITDDKQIEGCVEWNEQRIHTTIHDSITPTPSFDVKKFVCDEKLVYVIRVEEGAEPPYITSSGKIYERLSSGSFTIKDSSKLSQIYNKREQLLAKMENKISIPPLSNNINNVYGYIDIGFSVVPSNINVAFELFNNIDLNDIAEKFSYMRNIGNISRVGNSIVYTLGGISTPSGKIPAHVNNFLEIMADGSARMRILLSNNNDADSSINMIIAITVLNSYKELYTNVMGSLFPSKVAYAKKFESLTVLRQFEPVVYYSDEVLEKSPELREENEKILVSIHKHREKMGIDKVVTNDRIPKTGLYTIDKRNMNLWGVEYTSESYINELFHSGFIKLGFVSDSDSV